jgi:hypothetical protein
MSKTLVLILFTFCFTPYYAQEKQQELDSVNVFADKSKGKIFDSSKTFVYDVYFIEANRDTLTKEILKMKGSDKPWKYQKKKQTELVIFYEPDFEGLKNFTHPLKAWEEIRRKRLLKSKRKKAEYWKNYTGFYESEITGKVENDSLIWLHPPRENQYKYTYLSAYPEVQFKELKIGGNWKNKLFILRGYPSNKEFVGTIINNLSVKDIVSDTVSGKIIDNCWRIESIDVHSELGESKSTFIFDEKYYGFIRMEFEYYNGIKIIFRLKEVIKEE